MSLNLPISIDLIHVSFHFYNRLRKLNHLAISLLLDHFVNRSPSFLHSGYLYSFIEFQNREFCLRTIHPRICRLLREQDDPYHVPSRSSKIHHILIHFSKFIHLGHLLDSIHHSILLDREHHFLIQLLASSLSRSWNPLFYQLPS